MKEAFFALFLGDGWMMDVMNSVGRLQYGTFTLALIMTFSKLNV